MGKRKRVLVTGATGGIGRAVVSALLREGHLVLAAGRNSRILEEIHAEGAGVIRADLTTGEGLDRVASAAGAPDVFISASGVGTFLHAHELPDELIDRMMDVNAASPMKLLRRILPGMMERGSGQIIFIASAAGKIPTKKASAYAASKAALLGYADALRLEMAPYVISVTSINPGPVDTPFLDIASPVSGYRESMAGYLTPPEKVAETAIGVIGRPVREVDLPWYMAAASRLHAVAPGLTERLGRSFFEKKE
ncbi:SDR family NAD(P)-dependent oxidoreductase [Bhargavaea beijingensis]|uniref:SDR family NAD(P)-dependent oxidoreductase n=1 Tax=Bhargavaea beijingensis TaxID=426756 RepID=UPI000B895498|nr:SDR family NAD(P)-dependent oxidoreductase [Bhargavaea beijingensis]